MFLKTLNIIHIFLVLGLAVFGAVSFFLGVGFVNDFSMDDDIFIYIIPSAALIGYLASNFLFRKSLSQIDRNEALGSKQAKYQSACIVRYSLIEGPAIFAFLQFMSLGYTLYFTIGACLTIYLATLKPSKQKAINDLNLSAIEQRELK